MCRRMSSLNIFNILLLLLLLYKYQTISGYFDFISEYLDPYIRLKIRSLLMIYENVLVFINKKVSHAIETNILAFNFKNKSYCQ